MTAGVRLRGREQKEVGPIRKRRGNKFERAESRLIGLRLAFTITLLLGGLFSAVAAEAEEVAKVPRIGHLNTNLVANPRLLALI